MIIDLNQIIRGLFSTMHMLENDLSKAPPVTFSADANMTAGPISNLKPAGEQMPLYLITVFQLTIPRTIPCLISPTNGHYSRFDPPR